MSFHSILQGDALTILRQIPDRIVHCCVTSPPYFGLRSYLPDGHNDKNMEIGAEQTPAEYVERIVEIMREIRRVLRDDGTCWLNIGDSYAGSRCGPQGLLGKMANRSIASQRMRRDADGMHCARAGAKPKDLLLIPAQVALALRADGWWLRSDTIWHKPNPMPESISDRPTSAHEHVFLLTKSTKYFYDAFAIMETGTVAAGTRGAKGSAERASVKGVNSRPPEYKIYDGTRNARNVWTIATRPYPGQHYATFPVDLPMRCISAGTSEFGCCATCGSPYKRYLSERAATDGRGAGNGFVRPERATMDGRGNDTAWVPTTRTTLGWVPTCEHISAEVGSCVVLDPFGGSGTTALAAERLGRNSIYIDLDERNLAMVDERLKKG